MMNKMLVWMKKNKKQIIKISIWSVFGIIFIPIILCTFILAIQSFDKNSVPSIGKYIPMIVTTNSMETTINGGDLIVSKKIDASEVDEDDVISFWDPNQNNVIVTHRVNKKYVENGITYFETKGDANEDPDSTPVSEEKVLGIYIGRIRHIGNVAMFLQSTNGLIFCLLIPLIIILIADYFYRKQYDSQKDKEIQSLREEIKQLKEEKDK